VIVNYNEIVLNTKNVILCLARKINYLGLFIAPKVIWQELLNIYTQFKSHNVVYI